MDQEDEASRQQSGSSTPANLFDQVSLGNYPAVARISAQHVNQLSPLLSRLHEALRKSSSKGAGHEFMESFESAVVKPEISLDTFPALQADSFSLRRQQAAFGKTLGKTTWIGLDRLNGMIGDVPSRKRKRKRNVHETSPESEKSRTSEDLPSTNEAQRPNNLKKESSREIQEKILTEMIQLVIQSLEADIEPESMLVLLANNDHKHTRKEKRPGGAINLGNKQELTGSSVSSISSSQVPTKALGAKAGILEVDTNLLESLRRSFPLAIDNDSILANPTEYLENGSIASMLGSFLQISPSLRAEHVASAMCRARLPDSDQYFSVLGLNDPICVPGLIRGCIKAHQTGQELGDEPSRAIATTARDAIKCMADLSSQCRGHVLHALASKGLLVDLQWELILASRDTLEISTFLIDLLAEESSSSEPKHGTGDLLRTESEETIQNTCSREEPAPRCVVSTLLPQNLDAISLVIDDIEKSGCKDGNLVASGLVSILFRGLCVLLLCIDSTKLESPVSKDDTKDLFLRAEALVVALLPKATGRLASILKVVYAFLWALLLEMEEPPTRFTLFDARFALSEWLPLEEWLECSYVGATEELFDNLVSSIALTNKSSTFGIVLFSLRKVGLELLCQALRDSREQETGVNRALSNRAKLSIEKKGGELGDSSLLRFILYESEIDGNELDPLARRVLVCTRRIAASEKLQVPIVSIVGFLSSVSSFFARDGNVRTWDTDSYRFLLQLLYTLEVSSLWKSSPFVVDPRLLPTSRLLKLVQEPHLQSIAPFLSEEVEERLVDLCPEVRGQVAVLESVSACWTKNTPSAAGSREMARKELCQAILREKVNDDDFAFGGKKTQHCFGVACSFLAISELCETVSSAALSTQFKDVQHSYVSLAKDPLVILQMPLKFWRMHPLRSVVVVILHFLLEANNNLVLESSSMVDASSELLFSRDLILVWSLLALLSRKDFAGDLALTGLMRSTVASRPGLLPMLVKQGLANAKLDWIVENVPECFNDANELLSTLEEEGYFSPAERLVAADAVLRISLRHGAQDGKKAGQMAYSALSQISSCWYLIIGPIGVPVGSIVTDEEGADITKIARNAGFRMLKAVVQLCPDNREVFIRTQCTMALQKVATLCKGEAATGLSATVAKQRKNVLKELSEAVRFAIERVSDVIDS